MHLERDWSSPVATNTLSEGDVSPSTSSDGAQPDETPAMPSSDDRLFVSQEDWWNNAARLRCVTHHPPVPSVGRTGTKRVTISAKADAGLAPDSARHHQR